uniref:Small-subunit processome Utp12 domain-containing protein n=1 Tax=Magallana gigas TaxID=29159 RepID=A0A8W8JAD7_MAGGI|nr:WD repeat-containing protein 3 [Crassostrea gigas]
MGLTKQYLRYVPGPVLGLVGGQKSNVVFLDIKGVKGKYCAVGACENVLVWDLRTGEKHLELQGEKGEVTQIAKSPDKRHVAVGYSDGLVKVFDLHGGEVKVNFSGHKSAVTALSYDHQGLRLVSGAKDTDVIVWDIVNESGLFRLKGHKGQITQVVFLKDKNVIVSSSKDTFIKFWDLDTQHCFKTLVGHRSEIYDFVIVRNGQRLITGSADSELRVWDIEYIDSLKLEEDAEPALKRMKMESEEEGEDEEEEDEDLHILKCTKVGSVMRQGRDRLVSMTTDAGGSVLACHGSNKYLEVFKLPSIENLQKHLAKRQKKLRKKARDSGTEEVGEALITVKDEIVQNGLHKMAANIVSVDTVLENPALCKVLVLLNNNMLQHCCIDLEQKQAEPQDMTKLVLPGHRTDVRTLSFSSDNTALLSASAESVKIWNRASSQCIRTMTCDYALCSLFAPGDRHVIIGTKSGKLQIFDVGSGGLLEEVEDHTGAVWSVSMSPDRRGIVTGGADKQVHFWKFELIMDEKFSLTSKRLTLELEKTLKMDEDVLCVKYSPDQRLIAVSLLDNTVKVFFADTLKFFLSLYGHKLPVTCMDISHDSTLLVSGSADRNIKIWGLDFGDCHKSIFAHDDSVMCTQFIAKTHLIFTGGKDGKIKQWDADKFELIVTLQGHHAEIWCMSVSSTGNFLATASHDKSIRLWEKTKEIVVLEEEREMEREKEDEEAIEGETVVPGETNTEVALAGKKSIETVKGAERLMEALDLYKEESAKLKDHKEQCQRKGQQLPPPSLNPLLMAYKCDTPERYMLEMLRKIKSSELEESLLVLPFSYVIDLLKVLEVFIDSAWEVELSCRCLFFLLRVHHGQITSNLVLLPVIDRLRQKTRDRVSELRDRIGFNRAGSEFIQRQIEMSQETIFFSDATGRYKERKKKKRAILAVKV